MNCPHCGEHIDAMPIDPELAKKCQPLSPMILYPNPKRVWSNPNANAAPAIGLSYEITVEGS